MTHADVQTWLDAYVASWRSNDAEAIAVLFTSEATYAYAPWREPLRGADAIVADWRREPDDPETWSATYAPLLVEGDRAVATGETVYRNEGKTYSNMFVLRFEGGRCADFVEWYMKHPSRA